MVLKIFGPGKLGSHSQKCNCQRTTIDWCEETCWKQRVLTSSPSEDIFRYSDTSLLLSITLIPSMSTASYVKHRPCSNDRNTCSCHSNTSRTHNDLANNLRSHEQQPTETIKCLVHLPLSQLRCEDSQQQSIKMNEQKSQVVGGKTRARTTKEQSFPVRHTTVKIGIQTRAREVLFCRPAATCHTKSNFCGASKHPYCGKLTEVIKAPLCAEPDFTARKIGVVHPLLELLQRVRVGVEVLQMARHSHLVLTCAHKKQIRSLFSHSK